MVKPKYIYQILLTIAALTFCSCKKAEVTEAPQQKESPTQESITTDEVKYDDLGYDKGLFTLEQNHSQVHPYEIIPMEKLQRAINLLMGSMMELLRNGMKMDKRVHTKCIRKECAMA